MKIRFDDKLPVPSTRKIQDTGQLIAEGNIARVGVLEYKASELGVMFSDRDPDSIVRVAQLADDLFSEETLDKFRSAPITIGHPLDDVNTLNMKVLGKGTLEGKPFRDNDHLASNIVLSDQEAIDLVGSGTCELSVRAYYQVTRVDDNMQYDAVRTISRVNHVAIVDKGRAGITCCISDGEDGSVEVQSVAALHIVEEGSVEVPVEASSEELDALKVSLSDAEQKLSETLVELEETKLKLEETLLDQETKLSDMLDKRFKFVNEVQGFEVDIDGKSELEVKREILEKNSVKLSDEATPEYVEARFQVLRETQTDSLDLSNVFKQAVVSLSDAAEEKPTKSLAEIARENMIARQSHKQ